MPVNVPSGGTQAPACKCARNTTEGDRSTALGAEAVIEALPDKANVGPARGSTGGGAMPPPTQLTVEARMRAHTVR
jgi:hypothetical protein